MNFSRYRALKFSSAAQLFFECGGEIFGVRRRKIILQGGGHTGLYWADTAPGYLKCCSLCL